MTKKKASFLFLLAKMEAPQKKIFVLYYEY